MQGFNFVNWILGFIQKVSKTSSHDVIKWSRCELKWFICIYIYIDVSNGLSISKWIYLQDTKIRLLRIYPYIYSPLSRWLILEAKVWGLFVQLVAANWQNNCFFGIHRTTLTDRSNQFHDECQPLVYARQCR